MPAFTTQCVKDCGLVRLHSVPRIVALVRPHSVPRIVALVRLHSVPRIVALVSAPTCRYSHQPKQFFKDGTVIFFSTGEEWSQPTKHENKIII